ncbi:3-phosphoshikimate 1-carboxyvinyltransferase [Clostridium polynesiense]|uniref:3-phosphoshikimate 1-carboxyvinyltransferase n=1 Tax=Clostridium polynesiense TaxID=1325933 RepID=UPI00058CAC6A|nr:3-phosphoshikimate 1-carboxyvinyltransferase [Clostridium polynesiense]
MSVIKLIPKPFKGNIQVPYSKSYGHRALICAALSNEPCTVENISFSQDITATLNCLKALGHKFSIKEDRVEFTGKNIQVESTLYCRESGSTLRFLIPIAALGSRPWTIKGSRTLMSRPLDIYREIFEQQGLTFNLNKTQGELNIKGPLRAEKFKVRGNVSSQFISGLLFALPIAEGNSIIELTTELQSEKYVDMTLEVMKSFGINIIKEENKYLIKGKDKYRAFNYSVEGDYSQAAFWLTAGALNGDIVIKNLSYNSLQPDSEIINILKAMGADIKMTSEGLRAVKSKTRGIDIDASQIPDIIPIIAVLASLSSGTTRIYNAARLRLKESDRLNAISQGLNALGAQVEEKEDSLIIKGVPFLKGGRVKGFNDHRIVMSLAIASTRCIEPVYIEDSEAVNKSYPKFFEDFSKCQAPDK